MKATLLQLGALGLVAGGLVVLLLKDKDVTVFVSLFSPVVSALFIVGHLANQDRVLDKINENTNGVLKQKIKDAVAEAMRERDQV